MDSSPMNPVQLVALLNSQRVVRVAFHNAGELYLVPLGYVWMDDCICCITIPGKKTHMASANPRVAFQVDDAGESGPFQWKSVTGEGVFEFVEDSEAISRIIPALMQRFADMPAEAREAIGDREVLVARIRPFTISGRAVEFGPERRMDAEDAGQ